jgi:hypothetical protein
MNSASLFIITVSSEPQELAWTKRVHLVSFWAAIRLNSAAGMGRSLSEEYVTED